MSVNVFKKLFVSNEKKKVETQSFYLYTIKQEVILMFGKKIADLRKQRNLSQYDLAEKLGFSRGKISNYEQGTREPDFETLKQIADFFDVSTDYLLGKTDKKQASAENNVELTDYQKEVLEFFDKSPIVNFKDKPDDLRSMLEDFEVYYEIIKAQQERKNRDN